MPNHHRKQQKVALSLSALILSGCLVQAQNASGASKTKVPAPTPTPIATPVPSNELEKAIDDALFSNGSNGTTSLDLRSLDLKALRNLYQARSYKPLFVDSNGVKDIVNSLRTTLTNKAAENGLRDLDYWTPAIQTRIKPGASIQTLAELDLLLAQSFYRYASDLATGRLNPQELTQNIADIEFPKRELKDLSALAALLDDGKKLEEGLQNLAPQNVAYVGLGDALARLTLIRQSGGWPALKPVKAIKPGASDANVPAIRARMVDLGYLRDSSQRDSKSLVYDGQLVNAVKAFQAGLKLGSDGVIGNGTFKALAATIDSKIDQLRANMERWRLLPRDLGSRYIFVDLGHQEFNLFNNGNIDLQMRVVVGQELRETPSFLDQINDVVVNPYWNAPTSIVIKDILPKAVANPFYFQDLHMRVFFNKQEIDPSGIDWSQFSALNPPPFNFREDPGPENSLGVLKFNLSMNHHSIYMHDTNHRELFAKDDRMFSSGCVRLEKPLALADYLLSPQGLNEVQIQAMIDNPMIIAKQISLKNPIRAYIVSTTIAVDLDGTVRFGHDIYGQDLRLAQALNGVRVDPNAGKSASHLGGGDAPW